MELKSDTVRDEEEESYSEMVKKEELLKDRWEGGNSEWETASSVGRGSRQGRKQGMWQEPWILTSAS